MPRHGPPRHHPALTPPPAVASRWQPSRSRHTGSAEVRIALATQVRGTHTPREVKHALAASHRPQGALVAVPQAPPELGLARCSSWPEPS